MSLRDDQASLPPGAALMEPCRTRAASATGRGVGAGFWDSGDNIRPMEGRFPGLTNAENVLYLFFTLWCCPSGTEDRCLTS